jgi:hypothetical protein
LTYCYEEFLSQDDYWCAESQRIAEWLELDQIEYGFVVTSMDEGYYNNLRKFDYRRIRFFEEEI